MEIKKEFPIFDDENLHYLDTAATSQKPQVVLDSIERYYKNYNGNPGRGSYKLVMDSTRIFEDSRKTVQRFLNAKEKEEIIFTKSTTESINLLAYSFGLEFINEGDEIILGITNHHANIVPWQMVAKKKKAKIKYIYLHENGQFDLDDFKYKISRRTKLVAFSAVSNVTGVVHPIDEVVEIAHNNGAYVLVDAAQALLHFPIDVLKSNIDFLAFSGHKLFAPMGIGILYGKRQLLEKMPPFLFGGDMIEFVTEQNSTFAPIPNKFEGGTQNVEGAYVLSEAINYLNGIGYDQINKIEHDLEMKALFELRNLGFVTTYHTENVERVGVIAFNVNGVHSHDVAFILDYYGVGVRSGHHCAQPLMNYLEIPSCCRASFGVYNDAGDVEKLIEGLRKVKEVFKL